eukprot:TRINITY_DN112409_c0_g1_i1.p1 TRINITY_DN112409_c0_g1~~TRINITY_DN112409_c0_g1_i1.p1  ORF type:complete len:201 (-),score=32.43 TRINITY_DN112409_c0_g1_i1:292-894(-)
MAMANARISAFLAATICAATLELVAAEQRPWQRLRDVIEGHCNRTSVVLIVGFGESPLAVDMHAAGFTNLTSIGFSEALASQMKMKYEDVPVSWQHMDWRSMTFADSTIDCLIDHSSLDALMARPQWEADIEAALRATDRVLRVGGVYLSVSMGDRRALLEASGLPWLIPNASVTADGGKEFAHICTKTAQHVRPRRSEL